MGRRTSADAKYLLPEVGDILPHPISGCVLKGLYFSLHPVRLVDRVVPEHVG